MTAAVKMAALCVLASPVIGVGVTRAQLQPPPFDATAPGATAPAPREPAAPTPRVTAAPAPRVTAPPAPPPPAPRAQPAQARAPQPQSDDDEAIDDPKVSRRLGTRIRVQPPAPAPVAKPSPPPAPAGPPPPEATPKPALPDVDAAGGLAAGVPAIERPYTPAAEAPFEPTLPRLKIGLRRFEFVQIGASNSSDGVAAPETFNNVSVDVYPVSRTVRVGLTSAFGWQSGTWLAHGDYFATQTVSLGLQYEDFGRVVPFVEGFAGVGYMRRLQFERTIPTAFWQFGADAGVELYVARVGYLSFAIGYLRPVNGFAKRQQFTSIFVDTWSFKLGIGI
jgi:hypothetical protein